MNKFARHFLPLSLRVRFLLATAGVVLVLSLAYGIVALVGYSVSFDKTTFRLLRGESNLFYTLAKWENDKISVELPENLDMQSPTMTLIYDETGKLLWTQRNIPWLIKSIQPEWLKTNGFHEIETNVDATSTLLSEDHSAQEKLKEVREDDDDAEMTHSVAVNIYPATARMPQLTIVVVDTIPIELKRSYMVWSWFVYVLAANLLLVIPLLWIAAWWSLRPIEALAREVRELEDHHREMLNPETTRELTSLVRNLNQLLKSERERYNKYRTTLTDLTHSLKTPLAVLQSTLRSLRNEKMSVSKAEPVMLEQISRISQQIGYYLHRASMRGSGVLLSRELHPVAPLLDNLISALNKVYQRKGVNISMDISPEISFVGEQNDFVEVMGNVLDNACKYCWSLSRFRLARPTIICIFSSKMTAQAFPTANVPWCLIAVSAPIPYDQDKAWGWLSRARLRNNTPGRSLPATVCSAVPVWRSFLADSIPHRKRNKHFCAFFHASR